MFNSQTEYTLIDNYFTNFERETILCKVQQKFGLRKFLFGACIIETWCLVAQLRLKQLLDGTDQKMHQKREIILGFAGYCHHFVENFYRIASPLTRLAHKNVKIE